MNVLESFSLKGRVALITGGAGLYGRQLVEALAEAGARTYIASRNLASLQAEADKYDNVKALELDLGDEASIRKVVADIVAESGRLDILVNNAVTRCACGTWDEGLDYFDKSLHVNASGVFVLTRLAAKEMKKVGGGSIINIGSYMGLLGPNPVNYVGTNMKTSSPIYFYEKGGLANFTRWAASVLGEFGIRVNCINPGGFWTETMPEPFVRQYSANTMLGRLANETDLKGILVFLASDASAYLTGTNIPVDGGYTAK